VLLEFNSQSDTGPFAYNRRNSTCLWLESLDGPWKAVQFSNWLELDRMEASNVKTRKTIVIQFKGNLEGNKRNSRVSIGVRYQRRTTLLVLIVYFIPHTHNQAFTISYRPPVSSSQTLAIDFHWNMQQSIRLATDGLFNTIQSSWSPSKFLVAWQSTALNQAFQ
jgi:hypothetical protein